ncbi:MAG: molybdopterin molybdotransferase MoeA [Oscillospiraceae bacterium]|jgi:molybdopterin molybdotransferase|nr:molybdopterin molybdotransferase MoeA [Oscillospiraceae bacterium]
MRIGVPYEEAQQMLLALPSIIMQTESVAVTEGRGRILAEDLYASIPIPPFHRSPFDGYAFRGCDTAGASAGEPVTLRITEEIACGDVPTVQLSAGYAAKILTGGMLPPGADCTIKYEKTVFTAETVTLSKPVKPGTDIILAGEDIPQGAVIARKGAVLTPALLGLITAVGHSTVSVFNAPKALIINTGSELISPGEPLPPGKIYNSGLVSLIGALEDMGISAVPFSVIPDDPDLFATELSKALPLCDVVVSTGGASVGDYDFCVAAAEKCGAEVLFRKAMIKPGGAMVAAQKDGKLLLMLSGNPGSALMALQFVARPYLLRLTGRENTFPEPIEVKLLQNFTKSSGRVRLLRGQMVFVQGEAYFEAFILQSGGALSSFRECDLIAEIPGDSPPLPAGTIVKAWRI